MGHSTTSGRSQTGVAAITANADNNNPAITKITKKDFEVVWEWQRGMLRGQENYGYYIIRAKKSGKEVARGFSSKRAASAWLGANIKIANEIRQGRIVVERDENGKITGGYRTKG